MEKKTELAKFPVIPARISEIPGNSRREFWSPRFPGIPEREFPVALMSIDGQGTKWRRNIAENFIRLSRVHQRYRQTDDRRQTDRQTDDRRTDDDI